MAIRIAAIVILASALSTAAIAQRGAGGGAGPAGGAPAGTPGSQPSGTAGVSPSSPPVGTPGVPGPTSGAGLPGGPGPGNAAVVPNQPAPPAVGSAGNTGVNSITPTSSGTPASSGRKSSAPQTAADTPAESAAASEFHPEAVIDRSLDKASEEITVMPAAELRELVAMLDVCTVKQHPADRQGKCGSAYTRYKLAFAKDRAIDRALAELDRVVRFQKMFRTTGARTTEYEDNINKRLRGTAALALATTQQTEQVSLKQRR